MRDHQIPSVSEHVENVSLYVRAGPFCRQQIARYGIMSVTPLGVTDRPREFTRHQDAHRCYTSVATGSASGQFVKYSRNTGHGPTCRRTV